MFDTTTKTCTNCVHCNVCKYRSRTEDLEVDAQKISEDMPTNIRVSAECAFFMQKESTPKSASIGPLSNSTDDWFYDSLNKVVNAQKEYNEKYNNKSRNFKFFV